MDIFDILLPPLYLMVIFMIAFKYTINKLKKDAVYRFFLPGLIVKIFGAIALGLVYFFYYGGGDTINYHYTATTFVNLLYSNPGDFLYVYFDQPLKSEFYLMNSDFSFTYWVNDPYAFFVAKCFVPVLIICGKSYMASAIVIASICYLAVWRLYMIFVREFPSLEKQFSWCILYTPSVVFWGGGIMKDSLTFSATCLYVYGFYWFFTQKKFKIGYLSALLLGAYLLISIKPYILFALLPGSTLWFITLRINRIKNGLVKLLFAPTLIVLGVIVGLFIIQNLGESLGQYSMEKVISKASGAQQDLKQSYYGGNTFDIGNYEPTVAGMLSVSHKAIFATLFRPTLLDARNIVMIFSALENTFILGFCLYLLFKLKVFKFFGLLTSHPLLMFSFVFSLFFAFSVGASISNFGTLVRLKIPCIPFFLSSLVILNYILNMTKKYKVKELSEVIAIQKSIATSSIRRTTSET
ncbi:MAG: hypothetical protein H0W61_04865 [Bacteroidetes bacterium]|nr:hypothetical protein [Bacteroidota bacterium]